MHSNSPDQLQTELIVVLSVSCRAACGSVDTNTAGWNISVKRQILPGFTAQYSMFYTDASCHVTLQLPPCVTVKLFPLTPETGGLLLRLHCKNICSKVVKQWTISLYSYLNSNNVLDIISKSHTKKVIVKYIEDSQEHNTGNQMILSSK